MIWQVAGPLMERRLGLLQLGYLGDLAWQVLRKLTSPVLLKGKTEGGKQAIAWQLFQCDLTWRLLPKRTSAILLKGNFEGG